MQHTDTSRLSVPVLASLGLVGLALRGALKFFSVNLVDPKLWEFGAIARNLLETGSYSFVQAGVPDAFMPPGYPLMIYGLYRLFGVTVAAHTVLTIILLIFEAALPVAVAWLANRIWGRRVALAAFLIALVWPTFLMLSGRLHSISIYYILIVAFCGVLVSRNMPLLRKAVLAGVLAGLFTCFRSEGYVLALPAAFALMCTAREAGSSWRKAVLPTLVFCGLLGVITAPWLIRNMTVFGRPVLSTAAGMNLLRGHHAEATGTARNMPGLEEDTVSVLGFRHWLEQSYSHPSALLEADGRFRERAIRFVLENPLAELRLMATKTFYFLVADFTHPVGRLAPVWVPSLLALVAGFVYWLRTGRRDWRQGVLWMIFAIQLGLSVAVFALLRYRMAVDFIPVLFATAWVVTLLERRGLTGFRKDISSAI